MIVELSTRTMDDSYVRKKLAKIYSRIPISSTYNADTAKIIRSELSPLLEVNAVLKYEFEVRSALQLEDRLITDDVDSAFHSIRTIIAEPADAYSDNRLYPSSLTNDLRTVVRVLLGIMEAPDKTKSLGNKEKTVGRKRGARVLYRGNNVYKFKKTEYRQKNWTYARLCGFVYSRCRLVGSKIEVAEVYRFMHPGSDYMVQKNENWKWLFDTVEAANRWAKDNELPKLMKCETQFIVRLGSE